MGNVPVFMNDILLRLVAVYIPVANHMNDMMSILREFESQKRVKKNRTDAWRLYRNRCDNGFSLHDGGNESVSQ